MRIFYFHHFLCSLDALGWQPCSSSIPCDSTRGLTCLSGLCQCDSYSYWDNGTIQWCEPKVISMIGYFFY
jgi:hypothetical protein